MHRLSLLPLIVLAPAFFAIDASSASAGRIRFDNTPHAFGPACYSLGGGSHVGIVCPPPSSNDGASPHGYGVPPLGPKHPPQHTGGGTFGPSLGNS